MISRKVLRKFDVLPKMMRTLALLQHHELHTYSKLTGSHSYKDMLEWR